MNRVENAIKAREDKLANAGQDAAARVKAACDKMMLVELEFYQTLKSLAQAHDIITVEEALTVYGIIGGEVPTVEKWRKRTLAERVTVLELMWELKCTMRINESEEGPARTRGATPRKTARRTRRQ